jgi:predicted peroxiredoxin
MKQHLAILLWATGPEHPHLCATPFVHAAAAAAMDVEVEVHFTSQSVLLLVPGRAAKLYVGEDRRATIYDRMREASRLGARFFACSDALAAYGLDNAQLIPELTGAAGAVAFSGRILDPQWATLVF